MVFSGEEVVRIRRTFHSEWQTRSKNKGATGAQNWWDIGCLLNGML